ncbi:MAG: prolyl oligopeptidase family serine peptidase [Acidimicrobiia bacterium]
MPVTAAMCAAGRDLGEPRLSPDGAVVAFVATRDGRGELVVVDAGGGPERVLTAGEPPRRARDLGGGVHDWLADGSGLVFVAASGALHVQPAGGGPVSWLWGPGTGSTVASPAVSPDGRRVAVVVDDRAVVVVELATGTARVVSDAHDFALDPVWAPDGRRLAWTAWDDPAMPWDDGRVVVATADGADRPRVVAGGGGSAAQQPRFSPDGTTLAVLDDRSGWCNLTLVPLDGGPVTALAEPFEHGGPSWGPGQRSFAWSPDGRTLAVTRNEDGFGRLLTWAPGPAGRRAAGAVEAATVGRGVHGGLSWRGGRLAAVRTGGATPTQIVVHEAGTRRTLAIGPVAGFPPAEPELVRWPGDDGTAVPGRLYRPDRASTAAPSAAAPSTAAPSTAVGPPPLLVWIHGGPTDQWPVTFRPRFSYWLDRGWAILVPDHRGSTGHGRAFAAALAGRWGELDVTDVAAGARAAAERGWGDPRRLVAMGSSAGGFTVLNLLATRPGVFAAGVDLFGPVDLLGLGTHRFEAHYNDTLVGPLPAASDRLRARSPLHRAAAIVDPLLVLHGADDPVVPVAQSLALVAELEALGRPVEHHVYEGEGHGWSRAATVVDELTRTEDFLRRHVLAR